MVWARMTIDWVICKSCLCPGLLFARGLGTPANPFVHRGPAFVHPCLVLFRKEAERGVPECDQGSTINFTQPILHVGDYGKRSEQWACEFKQSGPLDGLDIGPEMPIAVAQVAVPPSTRPRFDLHVERFAIRCLVAGSQLLKQRGKGYIQGRLDMDLLIDCQGQVFEGLFGCNHRFSLGFGSEKFNSVEPRRAIASARSFTRFN